MHEPEHLTPAEVAQLLGVAPVTVRAWAGRGLRAERVTPGGHRRFRRAEVERFARERGIPLPVQTAIAVPRTLVVDDDPQVRTLLGEFLTRREVPHALACDGFEAGLLVATFRPQLVLLDLLMPGLDGLEVCRRIKAEVATRAVRVVMMSGHFAPGRIGAARAAGVEACLTKPLRLEEVATVLDRHAARAATGDGTSA